jgi:hypothetical protein
MDQEENHWENINALLSKAGNSLNILEEEIDIHVQRQFMALSARLLKKAREHEEILVRARDSVDLLEDDRVAEGEKKKLLVLLATIDDVAIYRAIEAFAKRDTPLKKWGTVALQQSRMLIQSTLMDEATVFVSTGLGGSDSRLRYFCVFIARGGTTLQPFQHDVIQKESELSLSQLDGRVEHVDFYDRYVTLTVLLPINVQLKAAFEGILEECNTYGNFLHEQMIITNVKKLTVPEIDAFLRDVQADI